MGSKVLPGVSILLFVISLFSYFGCSGKKEDLSQTQDIPDLLAEESETDSLETEEPKEEEKTLEQIEEKEYIDHTSKPTSSNSAPSFSGEFSESGNYTVQISASRSEIASNQLSEKIKAENYPAYVAVVESPTPDNIGTFYRVRIGYFNGVSVAKSFGESVASDLGYSWWVDNRSNDNTGMGMSNMEAKNPEASIPQQDLPSEQEAPATTEQPATTPQATYQQPVVDNNTTENDSSSVAAPPANTTTPADNWGTDETNGSENGEATDWGTTDTASETNEW